MSYTCTAKTLPSAPKELQLSAQGTKNSQLAVTIHRANVRGWLRATMRLLIHILTYPLYLGTAPSHIAPESPSLHLSPYDCPQG